MDLSCDIPEILPISSLENVFPGLDNISTKTFFSELLILLFFSSNLIIILLRFISALPTK